MGAGELRLRPWFQVCPGGAHRLAQDADVADVVGQQQDEPGVDELALLVAQAAMHLDQRLVEVVGGREIELGLQLCHAEYSEVRTPVARASASRTERTSSRRQRAATC